MLKSKQSWLILGIGVLLLAAAGCAAVRRGIAGPGASPAESQTGEVTTITAISSVASSGAVVARQSGSLSWQTTGTVATVNVKVGDKVKAGDALMTLSPTGAPQNVIMAQADLISAQKALDELQHPTAQDLANGQQAVANAQEALNTAQKNLRYAQNPVGQSLLDAVRDTTVALDTAQANAQLATVSQDVQDYNGFYWITDWYFGRYQDTKAKYDANTGSQELQDAMNKAWSDYQAYADKQAQRQLRIQTDQANKQNALAQAQSNYDTAVANLHYAQQGPDAIKLAKAQASVAVAEANLADAQDKLNKLQHGADPQDIATATARVQAAQATVSALTITAPFDGEVMALNCQPGDTAAPGQAAVVLADRSQLHVDVLVDEADVTAIKVGNPVTVTFDSIPKLALTGSTSHINPLGQTVNNLVKYTVRVDVTQSDARVLLGMTANVDIVTQVQEGVLAVPLDAVQRDNQSEFVMRMKPGQPPERVNVVSGQPQGDLVVVTGDLQPGDQVQLVQPTPTNNGSPFGPGG